MRYHYYLFTHCSGCGREINHWLETFCATANSKEAPLSLNPHHHCYVGKEPWEYPRKDDVIPGATYQYFVWSDQECEICQEERHGTKKRAQTMARDQIRMVNSNQKSVNPRALEETNSNLRKDSFRSQGQAKADPHLRNGRRALSKEEKRQRKLQIEALFSDPKALEEQQRLFGEAIVRMQQRQQRL